MKNRDLISVVTLMAGAVCVIAIGLYAALGFSVKSMRVDHAEDETSAEDMEGDDTEIASNDITTVAAADTASDAEENASAETEPETTREPYTGETKEPESLSADRELRGVSTLSEDEIENLTQAYDGTTSTYFVGLTDVAADEYNRPAVASDLEAVFADSDVRLTVFASDQTTAKAAFTFNCAEDAGVTKEILDVLKEKKVKATFYVSYFFALHNSDLVKRMIDEGHEVGSYSYICPDEGAASYEPDDLMADAVNMQSYIQKNFDYTMQKYSFNYGIWSKRAVKLISDMGYEVCFFSSNLNDESAETVLDSAEVISDLEKNLHNGCIYNFNNVNEIIPDVLSAVIDSTQEQGFTIVQLD